MSTEPCGAARGRGQASACLRFRGVVCETTRFKRQMGAGSRGAYATLVATKEFALGAVVLARAPRHGSQRWISSKSL
jgi:hypothetical protein